MSSPPAQPSLPWRAASSVVMGVTAALSRGFLYGFNKTETVGLDRFIEVLDSRKNPEDRDRGLITG
jgi:monolysocardiolipin acyltransferase